MVITATATQTEVHVPALMDGDKVAVPQFWLGNDIEYRTLTTEKALEYGAKVFPGNYQRIDDELAEILKGSQVQLRAAYYNLSTDLPTLAELRRAYFDKSEGSFISPDYRQSVLSNRGRGEWTSTFLQDGQNAVEMPENVVYRDGLWVLEGGKVTDVKGNLPPNGWTLEYDKPTGFPSRTSQKRKDAEKVFGDDTSYFYRTTSGVRAVLRVFYLDDYGPFYVNALYGPDYRLSYFGGRACRRSEQDAKRLATPIETGDEPTISMSMQEYVTLMENYRQLTEVHDRFGQEYRALTEAHQRVGNLLARINVQK